MKILCLVSWQPQGRWLWEYAPDQSDQVDFLYINHPKDRFPGYGKLLGYYQVFFGLGVRALLKMKDYDFIVTWEANTGLPLAFYRSLLGKSLPPLLILNFVLKGKPVLDTLWLTKFAMRSVSHITCVSQREIDAYSQLLKFPKDRCHKVQGPWYAQPFQTIPQHSGNYIFSAGRSHRDYGTLFEAVRGIEIPVVVNARNFNVKGLERPSNVTVNPFLPFPEFIGIISQAKIVVLPLYEAKHASGETFLIQAMAAGKAVIATRTYSTEELIEHGRNGLLVEPGDASGLRSAIQSLLDHPEQAELLGEAAWQDYQRRWAFPLVAREVVELVSALGSGIG